MGWGTRRIAGHPTRHPQHKNPHHVALAPQPIAPAPCTLIKPEFAPQFRDASIISAANTKPKGPAATNCHQAFSLRRAIRGGVETRPYEPGVTVYSAGCGAGRLLPACFTPVVSEIRIM